MSSSAPTATRYRLTGAAFLLALAVVFGPMLFDGAGLPRVALGPMPEATPANAVTAPEHAFEDLDAISERAAELRGALDEDHFEMAAAQPIPAPAPTTEPAVAAPSPAALAAGRAHGADPGIAEVSDSTAVWAVQVASFSNRENALALRGKLRAEGFEAFLSDVKLQAKIMTRVAVGPYLSEADADRAVRNISDQFELDARIVSMVI